jgi:CAAX prenyl protease-like protein
VAGAGSEHAVLAAALLIPFVVLMAASIVTTALSAGFDAWYPLKVSAAAAALWYFRATYRQLGWAWSWPSVAIGVAVFVLWILLEPAPAEPPALPSQLAALPAWLAGVWLAFRLLGSVVVVPLVEELAFRGYLLRKLAASRFEEVDPRRFSLFAFVASSLLFGVLHGRWLAGTLAGMAYALVVYRRGQIGDAVVAHGTTNALIALAVLLFGQWGLWT